MLLTTLLLLPIANGPAPHVAPAPHSFPGLRVAAEDPRAALDRAMKQLVTDLEDLAGFCQKKRAYLQRNKTYEFLLEYEPDHELARKTLGYKWDRKTETWKEPKRPKTPKDADPEMALEAVERMEQVVEAHRDRVLAVLDEHPDWPHHLADAELAKLVKLLPDDPEVRARRGQVQATIDGKQRWVSAETARTARTRERNKAEKKRLMGSKPEVSAGQLEDWEQELGVKWSGVTETDSIRVVAMVGDSERKNLAQMAHVMWSYAGYLTGVDSEHVYSIYVVTGDSNWNSMITKWPGQVQQGRREFLLRVSGCWMGSNALCIKGQNNTLRADLMMNSSAGMFLGRYQLPPNCAWLNEGFSLYQTKHLLGTRLTFSVKPSEYTDPNESNFMSRLSGSNANWLRMCRKLLRKSPKIHFSLGRDVNQLTADDLLIGYALTAYLLEGCEEGTFDEVARKIGQEQKNSIEALEEVLKMDLPTLTKRLLEWLEETA